jgi:hypothetical protein
MVTPVLIVATAWSTPLCSLDCRGPPVGFRVPSDWRV